MLGNDRYGPPTGGGVRGDAADARRRACAECGELLDREGQFHPHALCVLKRAYPSRSSWDSLRQTVTYLGITLPEQAPLVRDLPLRDRNAR